nr:hypothetical protein [Tanacetum cinerariifolium]
QAKGQEVGEEEEIQVFWFKEVKEDVDTAIEMDADIQGRMEEDVTTDKEVNVAKPTHMLRGRLLASFQDLEHEGGDTGIARRHEIQG